LQVAGDGPDRQRLGQLAIDHHCADEIEWLGSVDHARVNALLAGADLFALPCRVDRNGDKDGIPVVLMEAMAARVPVIAGDLPAIRELVSSGNNGLLVPGNDVAALASALMLLAGDVPLRRRFGDAGRARVLEEFSLEQNVERLEKAMMASISRRCAEHTNAAGTGKQTDLVIGR
jgi:glycosyltransferase involved in cell wall biosynthesis